MPERVPIRLLPDVLDPERIRPNEQGLQVFHSSDHAVGLARDRRLSQSRNPGIRFDQDEDIVAPPGAYRDGPHPGNREPPAQPNTPTFPRIESGSNNDYDASSAASITTDSPDPLASGRTSRTAPS